MGNKEKNHYSPVLANKRWCDETSHYWAYEINAHHGRIEGKTKGIEQWGFKKRLYSAATESALDSVLETRIDPIYDALLRGASLSDEQSLLWAQFLRSQFVRTPTFMRYEDFACERLNIEKSAPCDRVGCENCQDLVCVTGRDWILLAAHKDDYFVRTDNPVYYTGFMEEASSVLYYPLTPKICFVACSLPEEQNFETNRSASRTTPAYWLDKGGALMLNFYFAKAADRSLIIHPSHKSSFSDKMFTDVLGKYPQVPYDLLNLSLGPTHELQEFLRKLMSAADGQEYPIQSHDGIAPRYSPRHV